MHNPTWILVNTMLYEYWITLYYMNKKNKRIFTLWKHNVKWILSNTMLIDY